MLGQRRAKARNEPLRGDLGEGIYHLRRAAVHGVRGVRATVIPAVASARGKAVPGAERMRKAVARGWGVAAASVALLPLVTAARGRATGADQWAATGFGALAAKAKNGKRSGRSRARLIRKKGSKAPGTRAGLLTGLFVGGAVSGGVAVAFMSRRSRSRWEECDRPRADGGWSMRGRRRSANDRVAGKAVETSEISSEEAADKASTSSDFAMAPASKRRKTAGNAGAGVEQPRVTHESGEAMTDQSAATPGS